MRVIVCAILAVAIWEFGFIVKTGEALAQSTKGNCSPVGTAVIGLQIVNCTAVNRELMESIRSKLALLETAGASRDLLLKKLRKELQDLSTLTSAASLAGKSDIEALRVLMKEFEGNIVLEVLDPIVKLQVDVTKVRYGFGEISWRIGGFIKGTYSEQFGPIESIGPYFDKINPYYQSPNLIQTHGTAFQGHDNEKLRWLTPQDPFFPKKDDGLIFNALSNFYFDLHCYFRGNVPSSVTSIDLPPADLHFNYRPVFDTQGRPDAPSFRVSYYYPSAFRFLTSYLPGGTTELNSLIEFVGAKCFVSVANLRTLDEEGKPLQDLYELIRNTIISNVSVKFEGRANYEPDGSKIREILRTKSTIVYSVAFPDQIGGF